MNSSRSYTCDNVRDAIVVGDTEFVRLAIESGFDPNTEDSDGSTPLIYAAELQNTAMVKLLLKHGADPLHKDKSGYDASQIAAWHGEWRMGAYTKESTEIRALLSAYSKSPTVSPFAWLKKLFFRQTRDISDRQKTSEP